MIGEPNVRRKEVWHMLRRMSDAPYQDRDGEEDRKPGGKTCAIAIWKVWAEGGECYGQNIVEERNPKHSGDTR